MYPKTVYLPITIASAEQLLTVARRNGWKDDPNVSEEENINQAETFCFQLYRNIMIKQLAIPFMEITKEEIENLTRTKVAEINAIAENAVGQVELE